MIGDIADASPRAPSPQISCYRTRTGEDNRELPPPTSISGWSTALAFFNCQSLHSPPSLRSTSPLGSVLSRLVAPRGSTSCPPHCCSRVRRVVPSSHSVVSIQIPTPSIHTHVNNRSPARYPFPLLIAPHASLMYCKRTGSFLSSPKQHRSVPSRPVTYHTHTYSHALRTCFPARSLKVQRLYGLPSRPVAASGRTHVGQRGTLEKRGTLSGCHWHTT